jgi:hypothetical protein
VAVLVLAAFPAVLAGLWVADWRGRLDHTVKPGPIRSSLVFTETDSLLREADRLAPELAALSDSARIKLATGLSTFLSLAEQLQDIQQVIDALRPRYLDLMKAPTSRDSLPGQTWVYDGLARERRRDSFLPDRSRESFRLSDWVAARNEARRGVSTTLPEPEPEPPFPADTLLSGDKAVRAVVLREAALTIGLSGDPRRALSMLRRTELPFSGNRIFEDPRAAGESGWVYRLLWYPDVRLAGDLASILRDALLPAAEKAWLSLVPADGNYDAKFGDLYDPAAIEAYLRWQLARSHATRGDADWFREHAGVLRTGPFLLHRWARGLARETAKIELPEPEQSNAELIEAEVSTGPQMIRELDHLAELEPGGVEQIRKALRGVDGAALRREIDPMLIEMDRRGFGEQAAFVVIGRVLAAAYPLNNYVAGAWSQSKTDLSQVAASGPHAWMRLLPVRVSAARAVGRAVAGVGREALLENVLLGELCFLEQRPWNLSRMPGPSDVALADFVPGLQYVHSTLVLVTGDRNGSLGVWRGK